MTRLHTAIHNLQPVAEILGWAAIACIALLALFAIACGGIYWCQQAAAWWRELRNPVRIEPTLATVLTMPQRRRQARRDGGAA